MQRIFAVTECPEEWDLLKSSFGSPTSLVDSLPPIHLPRASYRHLSHYTYYTDKEPYIVYHIQITGFLLAFWFISRFQISIHQGTIRHLKPSTSPRSLSSWWSFHRCPALALLYPTHPKWDTPLEGHRYHEPLGVIWMVDAHMEYVGGRCLELQWADYIWLTGEMQTPDRLNPVETIWSQGPQTMISHSFISSKILVNSTFSIYMKDLN